jgi:glycolate oxidase FAD binding subunit
MSLETLRARTIDPPPGAPQTEFVVAVDDATDAAAVLRTASESGLRTLIWGSGTHQGRGSVTDPDLLLLTSSLTGVIAYAPDDLTLVVGAGTTLGEIEAVLAEHSQSAILPETRPGATIGGVVAAGISGWQRLRYGPTRDRVLETTLATGDGRVVRSGGRVVKNATGYDIPKLVTGSLGALGVIASVCVKVWPAPAATATFSLGEAADAAAAYRPLAVIETNDATRVYLGGRPAEIAAQATAMGVEPVAGLDFPADFDDELEASVLIEPSQTAAAVAEITRILTTARYQAAHGVGEVRLGADADQAEAVLELREWTERHGGSLIRTRGDAIEAWGRPPDGIELQRRVKAAFDPMGTCNPGRLPGGL